MKEQTLLDLPRSEPSPHEAATVADLITPFQVELIKDFCKRLKTTPAVEVEGLFGPLARFYHLSQRSGDMLIVELRNVYVRQYGLPCPSDQTPNVRDVRQAVSSTHAPDESH